MQTWFAAELDKLTGESVEEARRREQSAFDHFTATHGPEVVLFGAGQLGRKLAAALPAMGLRLQAFADNNSALWGAHVCGAPVLPPADAAARYGKSAVFVVSIWSAVARFEDRVRELELLGCETVAPFIFPMWKRPAELLPHCAVDLPSRMLEQARDIRLCANLWSDDASRLEYLAQLRWRLYGDFAGLPVAAPEAQYFPKDLFRLKDDEVFVDGGAFRGDTLEAFLDESRGRFGKAICFEPDPANFEALRQYVATLPEGISGRVVLQPYAIGAREETVRFCGTGDVGARIGAGDLEIKSIALDETPEIARASFLKMDVEGAEYDALCGARRTIRAESPVLAVCAYHTADHLWRLPLAIDAIRPGYRFFLRPYRQVWELVCYAVPAERRCDLNHALH